MGEDPLNNKLGVDWGAKARVGNGAYERVGASFKGPPPQLFNVVTRMLVFTSTEVIFLSNPNYSGPLPVCMSWTIVW